MDKQYWRRVATGIMEARVGDALGWKSTRVILSRVNGIYQVHTQRQTNEGDDHHQLIEVGVYRLYSDAITECAKTFNLVKW